MDKTKTPKHQSSTRKKYLKKEIIQILLEWEEELQTMFRKQMMI